MFRRIFDGALVALLLWFALSRLDPGGIVIGLALGAVIAWTGWRIAGLWRRYRRITAELAAAEADEHSTDPAARRRARRTLDDRYPGWHAADMTLWAGFFLGTATLHADRGLPPGGLDSGAAGDLSGGGDAGSGDGGLFGGGFDGGGFGGDGGGM